MVWKSGQCAASLSASLNLSKASNTCVAMPWACHRARQSKCSGFQNVVRSGAKSELSADAATFSPPPPVRPAHDLKNSAGGTMQSKRVLTRASGPLGNGPTGG